MKIGSLGTALKSKHGALQEMLASPREVCTLQINRTSNIKERIRLDFFVPAIKFKTVTRKRTLEK